MLCGGTPTLELPLFFLSLRNAPPQRSVTKVTLRDFFLVDLIHNVKPAVESSGGVGASACYLYRPFAGA